jgi:hypothetical protein
VLKTRFAAALLAALASSVASAGVYTDQLSKCLVDSTTTEDRTMLVKWLFTAASVHPAISSLSTVTAADRDTANQVIADLFVKLLTESCRDPAKTALKFEGAVTIQQSFQVLGQVAGMELFSNPQVAAVMTELDKHFDPAKLKVLTDEAASP